MVVRADVGTDRELRERYAKQLHWLAEQISFGRIIVHVERYTRLHGGDNTKLLELIYTENTGG